MKPRSNEGKHSERETGVRIHAVAVLSNLFYRTPKLCRIMAG